MLDLDWNAPAGIVEFCGGDALMRREVLESVGGFDERLIAGEEPEMCRRIRELGFTILHVDRPMTGHDLAMTRFSQYWRRAVRTGYAYAEVSARFRNTDLPLWDRKARRNIVHGAGLLGIIVGAPLCSIAFHSLIPVAIAVAIIAVLAIRTAIKFRWKTADPATIASVRSALAPGSDTSSVRSAQISARSLYRQDFETHRVQGKSCPRGRHCKKVNGSASVEHYRFRRLHELIALIWRPS